jgi:hypothetical protein
MGRVCGIGSAIDRMYIELCPFDGRVQFLGPFMVQYLFLGVPKRDFGSHPWRVVSSSYQKMVHCNSSSQNSAKYGIVFRAFRAS